MKMRKNKVFWQNIVKLKCLTKRILLNREFLFIVLKIGHPITQSGQFFAQRVKNGKVYTINVCPLKSTIHVGDDAVSDSSRVGLRRQKRAHPSEPVLKCGHLIHQLREQLTT